MSFIHTGFKKNYSNRQASEKDKEADYSLNLLRFGIVREAIKEYYECERKLNKLDSNDKSGFNQMKVRRLRKKMQETLDFFETPIGNKIAFGLGEIIIDSIKLHTIDVNKLNLYLKR